MLIHYLFCQKSKSPLWSSYFICFSNLVTIWDKACDKVTRKRKWQFIMFTFHDISDHMITEQWYIAVRFNTVGVKGTKNLVNQSGHKLSLIRLNLKCKFCQHLSLSVFVSFLFTLQHVVVPVITIIILNNKFWATFCSTWHVKLMFFLLRCLST